MDKIEFTNDEILELEMKMSNDMGRGQDIERSEEETEELKNAI